MGPSKTFSYTEYVQYSCIPCLETVIGVVCVAAVVVVVELRSRLEPVGEVFFVMFLHRFSHRNRRLLRLLLHTVQQVGNRQI